MGKSKIQKPKSRTAKRAVTPPIELNVERPASPSQRQKVAVLGLRGDNGVQKKKAVRGKQLSTKQKQRKEKMMERAEAVNEKLASKRDVSVQKSKAVQRRRVSAPRAYSDTRELGLMQNLGPLGSLE